MGQARLEARDALPSGTRPRLASLPTAWLPSLQLRTHRDPFFRHPIVPSDQEDSPPKPGNPGPARVPATRDTSPSEGQVHDDGIECQDQVDRGPGRGHHNTSRRTRSAGRDALAPLAAPPSPRFTEIRPAAWGHRHRSTRHRTLHRITTGHRLPRREPEQRAPACGTGLAPTGVPDGC